MKKLLIASFLAVAVMAGPVTVTTFDANAQFVGGSGGTPVYVPVKVKKKKANGGTTYVEQPVYVGCTFEDHSVFAEYCSFQECVDGTC